MFDLLNHRLIYLLESHDMSNLIFSHFIIVLCDSREKLNDDYFYLKFA